jgi:hypothetical protein
MMFGERGMRNLLVDPIFSTNRNHSTTSASASIRDSEIFEARIRDYTVAHNFHHSAVDE